MEKSIIVPRKALEFILLQRTEYLDHNPIIGIFSKVLTIKYSRKIGIRLKSFIFGSTIKRRFIDDMNNEYERIRGFLPERAESVLDIGCGVAGIDVMISRHYGNNIDVFLLDKTSIDKNVYYGYRKTGSFYNSLNVAKKILSCNGAGHNNIHIQEANDKNEIKFSSQFDLVISLLSWGFHYPVGTYLDDVYNKMKPGGILIIDVRKDTRGEEEIRNKFGNIKIVYEARKILRISAKK